MPYKDEILDTKYQVILVEQSYTDHEYGGWTGGQVKVIKDFKDRDEAESFLADCNEWIEETSKKYHGKISYSIRPMYYREHYYYEWVETDKTEAEMNAWIANLLPKKREPKEYYG